MTGITKALVHASPTVPNLTIAIYVAAHLLVIRTEAAQAVHTNLVVAFVAAARRAHRPHVFARATINVVADESR
jgi:hypothetical protein